MIVFSPPKPFTEKTRPIQLTAIRSWKRALPAARCILFGNEDGLSEICRSEAIEYGGPAETDAGGCKIISKIFQHACRCDPGEIAVFVNSDILLDASAQPALELLERFPGPFLATARRRCLSAWTGPALAGKDLESFLEARRHPVCWGSACALDIFIFRGFPCRPCPTSASARPPVVHQYDRVLKT
jgi:hypothetical protein